MSRRLAGASITEKLMLNRHIDGDCWRWSGAHTPTGYGQVVVDGEVRAVHRIAYELAAGEIPVGMEIDHLCQVRDCINPAHLEAVTHAENIRRTAERRTRCKRGHELTPANTKWKRAGNGRYGRACRTCSNDDRRAARRRNEERTNA